MRATMMSTVFYAVKWRSLGGLFEGTYSLHLHGWKAKQTTGGENLAYSSTLKWRRCVPSKRRVLSTIQRYNREDRTLWCSFCCSLMMHRSKTFDCSAAMFRPLTYVTQNASWKHVCSNYEKFRIITYLYIHGELKENVVGFNKVSLTFNAHWLKGDCYEVLREMHEPFWPLDAPVCTWVLWKP
jgi:hypothetical protein